MRPSRTIPCPRCGGAVRIPFFWIMGIEGIFRCRGCGLPFKTGYRMGALLFALALSLSIATVQLFVYVFGAYTLWFFILLVIPLWLFYGYLFRRGYMLYRMKRREKRKPL